MGASANVPLVVRTAPVLFCYSFIALAGHLLLLLLLGRLAGFSRRDLLLASNANIGGGYRVANGTVTSCGHGCEGWRQGPLVATAVNFAAWKLQLAQVKS